ncbi:MAG: T9SS type A sorting domain-containing protein [Muribaculaceae bacterium]|nr:T9SS type A sorting domain-containing protein [Muribaculaceae bacterium]
MFDMTGRRVISLNGVGSLSADMTPLPAGIYIIKANDKTIKYIR